ncbi:MazG-like protein [Salinicoccus hispanicus]|uniref:MazG-like protein n=1 Tax=Salinicoccus hispanicus TaxID=157225 RepID=A0A6N8U0X4_9STAP|nr:MazG-like protein [Salinicoccus hispanicus]MXQ49995.1 MazG-like protein [Salinicoccus hispanicus]
MEFRQAVDQSIEIRKAYHKLEEMHHGSRWSVQEDALAFLTDAARVGRLTMAREERWPMGNNPESELTHKVGESIWWLIVLAERMGIDSNDALESFLEKKKSDFL